MKDGAEILIWMALCFPPLLMASTLHEAAHAWMADRFGDAGPKKAGRLSFNPLRHFDIVGTGALPLLCAVFGLPSILFWGKPLEYDIDALQDPGKLQAVAMAGPAANLVQLLLWALVLHATSLLASGDVLVALTTMAKYGLICNAALLVFNLLPLPPLDGAKLWMGLLKGKLRTAAFDIEARWGVLMIPLFMVAGVGALIGPALATIISLVA